MKGLGVSAALLLTATSAGCGGGEIGGASASGCNGVGGASSGSREIMVSGAKRSYELVVPAAYDGRTPLALVLAFHGDGGRGVDLKKAFALEAASGAAAVLVYPNGLDRSWRIDTKAELAQDIEFSDSLVRALTKELCVDERRVFATGFSKGAYFVNQLACRTGAPLRAIATHSGGGPFGVDASEFDGQGNLLCPSSAAVGALQVHGTADQVVAVSEGEKARDHWRAAGGCRDTTQPREPAPCVAYDGCGEVWCLVPGLGHALWPSNAAKATWDFFAAF